MLVGLDLSQVTNLPEPDRTDRPERQSIFSSKAKAEARKWQPGTSKRLTAKASGDEKGTERGATHRATSPTRKSGIEVEPVSPARTSRPAASSFGGGSGGCSGSQLGEWRQKARDSKTRPVWRASSPDLAADRPADPPRTRRTAMSRRSSSTGRTFDKPMRLSANGSCKSRAELSALVAQKHSAPPTNPDERPASPRKRPVVRQAACGGEEGSFFSRMEDAREEMYGTDPRGPLFPRAGGFHRTGASPPPGYRASPYRGRSAAPKGDEIDPYALLAMPMARQRSRGGKGEEAPPAEPADGASEDSPEGMIPMHTMPLDEHQARELERQKATNPVFTDPRWRRPASAPPERRVFATHAARSDFIRQEAHLHKMGGTRAFGGSTGFSTGHFTDNVKVYKPVTTVPRDPEGFASFGTFASERRRGLSREIREKHYRERSRPSPYDLTSEQVHDRADHHLRPYDRDVDPHVNPDMRWHRDPAGRQSLWTGHVDASQYNATISRWIESLR